MITVLLPTYNAEDYISPCIKSILLQTFKDFELLIIDSESTDGTVEIIRSFTDKRINLQHINRCNLAESLNYGLKIAKYDFIARMDVDDLMVPERLEVQFGYKMQNPEADIISCNSAFFSNRKILFPLDLPEFDSEIKKKFALHNVINHPGCFFERKVVLNAGGYASDYQICEDYELWLRLYKNVTFINIQKYLVFMRFNANSLSRYDIIETNAKVYAIHKKYLPSFMGNGKGNNDIANKELLGWREYFYGNKNLARKYWRNPVSSFSFFAAFLLTWLPEALFLHVKEMRLRLRLDYLLTYYSGKNISVRKSFNRLLKSVT